MKFRKNMLFKPNFNPPAVEPASALWFIFDNGRLLIKIKNDSCSIHDTSELKKFKSSIIRSSFSFSHPFSWAANEMSKMPV